MSFDAKAGFTGLVTATSELGAPQGALRVADNVTLRKEGALALRTTFGSTALARAYVAAFPYSGAFIYVGASNQPYDASQNAFAVIDAQTPYTGLRGDVSSAKEARKNFYLAMRAGVAKTPTGATMYRAGVRANEIGLFQVTLGTTTAPELLAASQQVAYRAVFVGTDPNGVIVRSRPSGAVVVQSTGAFSPTLQLSVSAHPAGMFTARTVEIYRTRIFPTSVTVDDEMQLVASLAVATASGSNTVSFTDKVLDIARGTTLYTSPSRGGIQAANDRPPGCACLERFRTSLFFGNIIGSQTFKLSYKYSAALAGSATGVGQRTTTGTPTVGSAVITGVTPVAGVQVGQYVVTTTAGQMGTVISVVGTTVTTDKAATGTGGSQTINFLDAVNFDSAVNFTGTISSLVLGGLGGIWATTSGTNTDIKYNVYELTPPEPGYDTTLVLECTARGGSAFLLRASHGNELSPALPLASVAPASGSSSSMDTTPHGLMWSEPDEPEHVPPKNFARVGDAGRAILALIATKDRLLIFKEDGLFMLTGDTAKNFAIYPLDTTALCILPGSVRRLQNTVYALTNLGLIAVDESGSVEVVSRPIQQDVALLVTAIRQTQQSTGTYLMPGLSGVTGTSDDPNGEYWLLLGSTSPSFGGQALIYNAFRNGFTTYSFGSPAPACVAQDASGQPLVLTASTLLTPNTGVFGAITARVSPRAFSDPALVGKVWTHVAAAFSTLTGCSSVTCTFTSSTSMLSATSVTETFEVNEVDGSSLIQLPGGSLLRHPLPRAMARSFMVWAELVVTITNGTFTLDAVGMEARDNIPNKNPSHGTGAG